MEIIKDESQYNMLDWWKKVFIENYANFEGRARRSEYWYYILMNLIITFSLTIVTFLLAFVIGIGAGILMYILLIGWGVANIVPSLAAQVRRLHDTNKSGLWVLLSLIPFGGLVLLAFYCIEGDYGKNQYGEDPKG